MFCLPCIIVCQYSETNVMHFLFNVLRILGLYMFPELLAHPHEALNKRHLVYCVRVMSVGCTSIGVGRQFCCMLCGGYVAACSRHIAYPQTTQNVINHNPNCHVTQQVQTSSLRMAHSCRNV
jgi:hypothetical protein